MLYCFGSGADNSRIHIYVGLHVGLHFSEVRVHNRFGIIKRAQDCGSQKKLGRVDVHLKSDYRHVDLYTQRQHSVCVEKR